MAAIGTGFNAGASDNGLAVTGSDSNAIAKDNGIALGAGAKLNTGLEFGSASNVTIGETGLGQTFANAIEKITEQNTATLSSIVQGQVQSALPRASDVPAVGDTANATTKPIWIYPALVVGALLLVFFMFNRSK